MDACATQLQDLRSTSLERREIELALAVVAEASLGLHSGLHAVGADNGTRAFVLHDQVRANRVERVRVQAAVIRLHQALVEFDIEDLETQRLGGGEVGGRLCQAR